MFCCFNFQGRHHKENGRGRAAQDRCRYRVVVVGDGECGKTSLVRRYCSDRFFGDYTPTLFDTETISDTVDGKEIELVIQDTAGQEDLDRLRPPFYLNKDAVIICFAVDNPDSLHNVETLWAPEVKKYCGQAPIILVGNKADLHFSHADADCKLTPDTAHCGQPCVHGTDFNSNALNFDPKDTSHKNHAASSRNNSGGNSGLKASVKKMILCPGCDVLWNSHDHRSVAGPAMAAKIGAVGYFETSAKLNSGVKDVFQAVLSAAASPARFRKKKKLWR